MTRLAFVLLVAFSASVRVAAAGQPPNPPASAATPATAAKPVNPADQPPAPPSNYAYAAEGRRDPFVSLVNRGTAGQKGSIKGGPRADGIGGITVDEVAVRGIVQSRGVWVAMIAAPTGRTYSIRAGDRLMDGTVRAVTAQAVVLMQEVNDPLSLQKQREVRKYLRGEVK
jgi:Tfp pilus assembly protein PilP